MPEWWIRARGAYRWLGRSRRTLAWIPSTIAALLIAASTVIFIFVPKPNGTYDEVPLAWGIGLLAAGILLTALVEILRAVRRAREHAEKVAFQISMNDAVLPILANLAAASTPEGANREQTLTKTIGNVGTALKVLLESHPRVRIIVYRVEPGRGRRPTRMVPIDSAGRQDPAGTFEDGSARGTPVFDWLRSAGATIFVDDVRIHPPEGWTNTGHHYRTFISSTIAAGSHGFGMLCVDSPDVGDLREPDVTVVDLLAGLLSVAFAEAQP